MKVAKPFEYGNRELSPTDTLPGYERAEMKLKVTGTIFKAESTTPAAGVILHIYHTNQKGIYPTRGDEKGWARRHGYIRGWMKTGTDGKYTFYTLKPASYPSRTAPAHIHPIILEADGRYYWISEYLFDYDPLVTSEVRSQDRDRGGKGIVMLRKEGELLIAKRDIVLGKNVPGYN